MGATGFVFLGHVNDSQGRLLILFAEVSLRSFVPGQHGCPGTPPPFEGRIGGAAVRVAACPLSL